MANELVLVSSRTEVRDARQDGRDQLSVELEAMSTIGRTLDAIEDPALRQRILNWAVQRWGADRPATVDNSSRATATPQPSDSDLSVDSIGDLFEGPGEAAAKREGKAPVESMLQSLAEDFQRLADEWNGA